MIRAAFNGMCMALADSVPGVSGGTIAFILGFYDHFIDALHDLISKDREQRKNAAVYLLKLGTGWVFGMGLCVWILAGLFTGQIYFMSSLFLGLTAAAIPFVIRAEKSCLDGRWENRLFWLLGTGLVVSLSLLRGSTGLIGSVELAKLTPLLFLYIFLSGAAAITAMVLPGISGSTILLIAGVYLPTIQAVKGLLQFQFAALPGIVALGLGVCFGICISIRFIRRALKSHRSKMVYLILGLMTGSFYAIIMGPQTLAEPLPALSLSTFSIIGFAAGVLILFGLERIKTVLQK